jgi:hypothetical protein
MKNIAAVWLHNSIVLAVASLDLETLLKLTLLVLSIAYTAWKWHREAKRKE